MQKVRLSIYGPDVDAALNVVQKAGAVEFTETTIQDSEEVDLLFPHAELLPRVQHAVQFLVPYAPKVSLWKSLREGTRKALSEAELIKQSNNFDTAEQLVEDFERLQVEFAEVNEKLRVLEEHKTHLASWLHVPIKLSDLNTPLTKTILLQQGSVNKNEALSDTVSTALTEAGLPYAVVEVSDTQIALVVSNEQDLLTRVDSVVNTLRNVEVANPPAGTETPEIEYTKVTEQLAKVKGEHALLVDQAEHFAHTHLSQLQIAGEVLSWQKARFDAVVAGAATAYTVSIDGWLNQRKRQSIEAEFASQKIAAVFSELELAEGEQPPVDIENHALIRPFEAVTRLYGMPGYTDLDPTAYLAGFFFLFFGLCLTDVGYGLALIVASLFVLLFTKATKSTKLFAKLLLFIGISTVLVGMLFGGYLGIEKDQLPAILNQLAYYDPIGNPLPVFYLALSLGVLQVMVGMLVKIYADYKNNKFVSGLLDQGPWLAMFSVGIVYILSSTGYVQLLSVEVIGNLAIVCAVLIVLTSGRNGEGVIGKVVSSFAGLYAGVGYFSDILSYSRLLALGLATSALAFAVNLIAGMVSGVPYVGFLLAAIILIIGHAFTLAINTLGAFVHSARLQFVEFFGKFITGTGRDFAPLRRSEKYIVVDED
jgi:V/A-type H+-transporting ATPase subunit I